MIVPRFYMDVDDGTTASYDVDGSDHDDAQAARQSAIRMLARTVHDTPTDKDTRNVRVDLRDERRKVIYRAVLSLREHWIEHP